MKLYFQIKTKRRLSYMFNVSFCTQTKKVGELIFVVVLHKVEVSVLSGSFVIDFFPRF